jgi:hypothetical protein
VINYFIICLVFLYSNCSSGLSGNISDKKVPDKNLKVGEEIVYLVKYLFFELGEVRLKVSDSYIENGDTIFKTIAFIDSYEGVPFVSLHQIYESEFNQNQIPLIFKGTVLGEEDTSYTKYTFNKRDKSVHIYRGKLDPPERWLDTTVYLNKDHQDGLSIFYYARMRTGQNRTYNIPCFVNEKSENTIINYYKESTPVKIDALDYDVDCVRLDGSTDFVSIFGLTGAFEGWFSNDSYAIPLIAKMKVIIGNINLELIEWNNDEWIPPKFIKENKK